MQKSIYADPKYQDHGFTNHLSHVVVDSGVFPGTANPLIELYSLELTQNINATSGTGGKPRNIYLFYKYIPLGGNMLSGAWQCIGKWQEGIDYDDSSAAGSVAVHPITGNVHVQMTFGKRDSNGNVCYQKWEEQIQRTSFTAPIERPPEF